MILLNQTTGRRRAALPLRVVYLSFEFIFIYFEFLENLQLGSQVFTE